MIITESSIRGYGLGLGVLVKQRALGCSATWSAAHALQPGGVASPCARQCLQIPELVRVFGFISLLKWSNSSLQSLQLGYRGVVNAGEPINPGCTQGCSIDSQIVEPIFLHEYVAGLALPESFDV